MILHTGGVADGAILTRSRLRSIANLSASLDDMIPSCAPSSETTLTSRSRISSLMECSVLLMFKHLRDIKNSLPLVKFLRPSKQKADKGPTKCAFIRNNNTLCTATAKRSMQNTSAKVIDRTTGIFHPYGENEDPKGRSALLSRDIVPNYQPFVNSKSKNNSVF